jgi:hypothetical protein
MKRAIRVGIATAALSLGLSGTMFAGPASANDCHIFIATQQHGGGYSTQYVLRNCNGQLEIVHSMYLDPEGFSVDWRTTILQ